MKEENRYSELRVKSYEYWQNLVKTKKRIIVFNGENVLDLTEFVARHPGGQKNISMYILQDIKNILFKVYPHSSQAYSTLHSFICGKLINSTDEFKQFPSYKNGRKTKSILVNTRGQKNKNLIIDKIQQKQNITRINKSKQQQKLRRSKESIQNAVIQVIQEQLCNLSENKIEIEVPCFKAKFELGSKNVCYDYDNN